MTKILVKMPNWVGDCIMATPALAMMRAALPGSTIDLLCRPSVAGILQDNPHKSKVIALDDRKLTPGDMKDLRSAQYDAIALMTNSLGSAWLGFRIGAKRRIGFNREGRGLLLTTKIPFKPLEWQSPTPQPLSRRSIKGQLLDGLPRHMVEYYLRIGSATVKAIDPGAGNGQPQSDFKLVLPLNREAESKVAAMMREAGIMGKSLIGINPGAAHGPAKRWSPERLGHLVDGLEREGWAFVSTAAPNESHLNDRVQAVTKVPIHRLGEKTSLRELPALISRLNVLVTNDSGAMHVAAARQVPTVAIFGPTDWPSTCPWQALTEPVYHRVPCAPCFLEECPIDHPCMDGVQPYDVAAAVVKMLHQSGRWQAER